VVLIDAGLGPRTVGKRLEGTGVALADIAAVCVTHLDRDHFSPTWAATLIKRQIRVCCHASRVEAMARLVPDQAFIDLLEPFSDEPFSPIEDVSVRAIRLEHYDEGSHGFIFEGFGCRIGFATDLGRVPVNLTDHFDELDVLALESNYDSRMQLDSGRPWFLKQRIMGGRGHLSNEQAFAAVRRVLDRCESRGSKLPGHIVLLHRSRDCNCPQIVRTLFSRDVRIAPRLVLAEQYQRTEWLRVREVGPAAGEQLVLGWG
jgi:hypothetical protein